MAQFYELFKTLIILLKNVTKIQPSSLCRNPIRPVTLSFANTVLLESTKSIFFKAFYTLDTQRLFKDLSFNGFHANSMARWAVRETCYQMAMTRALRAL